MYRLQKVLQHKQRHLRPRVGFSLYLLRRVRGGERVKAINGPCEGKHYKTPKITNKVVDVVKYGQSLFEVTYYRTKNGWAYHSWKHIFSLYIKKGEKL